MKLHNYSDDRMVKRLNELSEKATPGQWKAAPKRLTISDPVRTYQGPMMSYLVGDQCSGAGLTVSLGSERVADHEFVAELVNAWRDGKLYVVMEG